MRNAVVSALAFALLAGCAQAPLDNIPVEEHASAGKRENPYGIISIQEPVEAPVSNSQWAEQLGYGGNGVSVFIPPDQVAKVEAADTPSFAEGDPSNLDADGLYDLGRQYIEGDGVEQNPSIGEHYIQLSAELGKDEAKRVLGLIRLKRDPKDSEALALLEDAATTSLKAQMQLGFLYANQAQPYLNDKPKGIGLIEQAYKGGSGEAAYYYSRLIKTSNPDASREALSFSVTQGFSKAVLEAAKASGSTKDASELYLRAARLGDANAMWTYANGLMIRKYKPTLTGYAHPAEVEALAWFSLADEKGNSMAATEVANLKGVLVEIAKHGSTLDEVKQQVQAFPVTAEAEQAGL